MHVAKNIQILIFLFFVLSFYAFWKFLRLVNSAWDFFRLIFGPGTSFFGGGGEEKVFGSPRDSFFGGGLIFVLIRSSPSLEISISWKTF